MTLPADVADLPPAVTMVGHQAPLEAKRPTQPPGALFAAATAALAITPNERIERGSIPPSISGTNPSLLIPKPAAGGADPRVTQLEVQLQAFRAQLSRAETDTQAAVKRAEAAEQKAASLVARIESLDAALASARAVLGERIDDAVARSDRPMSVRPLEERLDKLEHGGGQLKANVAAAQQELAEYGRLFESRKARVDSLEARIARLESDARFAELRRLIDSLDLRLSPIESGRDAPLTQLAQRIDAQAARLAELEAARASAAPTAEPTTSKRRATGTQKKPEDGLSGIKGIGPKYQKQLQELGVTSAAQVAAWSDADLDRIAAALGMPRKKLDKLGWVDSAKAALG